MLTDAHCHPYDLNRIFTDSKCRFDVLAASSACEINEFLFNESFAHNAAAADFNLSLLPCFGIHPQLPALKIADGIKFTDKLLDDLLFTLDDLASSGRLSAVGECGFDFYNNELKQTETLQDILFKAHLETAIFCGLPVVLHVRRAIHKIFTYVKILKKCKSVIFHSWHGALEEAQFLMRCGVNAYFSFGNIITLNHKKALRSCALLPAERLLTETDAPYIPQRTKSFSHWADLPLILEEAVSLRCKAGNKTSLKDFEEQIENNFRKAFAFYESYPLLSAAPSS
ncbi:MAG: TatD family hydrolase [Treponema sp.]|nr:TatD family hydrolase [Treponema sp.]